MDPSNTTMKRKSQVLFLDIKIHILQELEKNIPAKGLQGSTTLKSGATNLTDEVYSLDNSI